MISKQQLAIGSVDTVISRWEETDEIFSTLANKFNLEVE